MLTEIGLFAGIGGFQLGYQQAGIETVAMVEIDSAAQGVLARRFPGVPILSDVREAGAHNLPRADILSFGFPCQDLSVAGKRSGLAGARSGLFYEATRIADELRPALLTWENVPGLLSSNSGRDFAAVLMELDRIGYSGCWTTLDAQFFGVAQRRQRIFGVFARRDIGAERCAEILSLPARLPWNTEKGGKARSGVAATIRGGSSRDGVNPPGRRGDDDQNIIAFDSTGGGGGSFADDGLAPTLKPGSGLGLPSGPAIAATLNSGGNNGGFRTEPGEHLVSVIKGAANGRAPENGPQYGEVLEDGTCYTLNCTEVHAVSIAENQRGELRTADIAAQLTNGGGKPGQGYPAIFEARYARNGRGAPDSVSPPLKAENGQTGKGDGAPLAMGGFGVRRLTPLECERLQGFDDGWTAGQPDSTRYRQLGNAVAVPVARWLGQQIVRCLYETL